MYLVIVYHDIDRYLINSLCLFDKIKDIIAWSKGIIKYNDIQKNDRKYKTYKSYFKIIEVNRRDETKYFPKFKKFLKKIRS